MEIYNPTWSRVSGLKDKLLSQQLRGFWHTSRHTHNSTKFRANSIDSTKEAKYDLEGNNTEQKWSVRYTVGTQNATIKHWEPKFHSEAFTIPI